MIKRHLLAALAAFTLFSISVARAEIAVGAKVSTLGAGLEFTTPVLPETMNFRFGGNMFTFSTSRTISAINYDAKLNLSSAVALFDWHPGGNPFRFSAGAVYNGNKFHLDGTPTGSNYTINGHAYSTANVSAVKGDVRFTPLAPYVGVGWGNPFGPGGRWRLSLELGAIYQGTPKLSYQVVGVGTVTPDVQADFDAEAAKARKDLDAYKFYPVIGFSISRRF
jgi:hypothetical protein